MLDIDYTQTINNKILIDEPMKKYTSFKIGGTADFFINVKTIEELKQAISFARKKNLQIYIIGNGSNLLVSDKGIRGIVIKVGLDNLEITRLPNYVEITVGAGYKTMALANKLCQEEISGFEELGGIPGTIGGSVYMNAGAYGKELKDINISTKCMDYDGNIYEFTNDEQKFEYRKSIFFENKYIILETKLKLNYGKKENINLKMQEYINVRKEKQPLEYPSAGSTFKRINGIITSKVIDECGLKGYCIGGAKVSEKHAGFIINYNNAKAKDVMELIAYIKEQVYEKTGIKIEEEVNYIGEF